MLQLVIAFVVGASQVGYVLSLELRLKAERILASAAAEVVSEPAEVVPMGSKTVAKGSKPVTQFDKILLNRQRFVVETV